LGLFYDKKEGPFPHFSSVSKLNFLNEDPIIRYWSVENKKRSNPEVEEPCSIVVHTSVGFGAENLERTKDSMKEFLMEKVKGAIKDVGENNPASVKCHKWKYSQVNWTILSFHCHFYTDFHSTGRQCFPRQAWTSTARRKCYISWRWIYSIWL
jgi:predicted NAD/FAD-dependent oxidoreductase